MQSLGARLPGAQTSGWESGRRRSLEWSGAAVGLPDPRLGKGGGLRRDQGPGCPPPCPHAPAPWLQDSSAVMGFHANPDTTPRSSEEVWCWGKRCPVAGLESGDVNCQRAARCPPPEALPPSFVPGMGRTLGHRLPVGAGWSSVAPRGQGHPCQAPPGQERSGGQRPRGYQKCNGPRSQAEAEATLLALSRNISSAPPTWLPFLERG